ncbi:MAG: hypothetical protein GY804_09335 [Alphaproteobacteria bacterium]|nr:hypothetical protein [Alphaproteobacteria bacterium]
MYFASKEKKRKNIIHLNTGVTAWDMATGKYVRAMDGGWILDGGLSCLLVGITGREQCYKSTLAQSILTRVLLIYPQLEAMIYDSENSLLDPLTRFTNFYGEEVARGLLERISVYNNTTHDLTDIVQLILEVVKEKKKLKQKDYLQTPFYDETTGGALYIIPPSIALMDSMTCSQSSVELDMLEKNEIDSSDNNVLALRDGNIKTKLVRAAVNFCPNSGICLLSTGHVGDKFNLNPREPKNKQLQYQNANEKVKGCGTGYTFLNSILVQSKTPNLCLNSAKSGPRYPVKGSNPKELTETGLSYQRCKNNSAGDLIQAVFSQHEGLLSEITDYHLLISKKYFGLDGTKQHHALTLYPDVSFAKHTLREKCKKDYKLKRAMELTAELCYIQEYWNTSMIDYKIDYNPVELKKAVEDHPKLNWNDILETRRTWSLNEKKEPRKRMTIMDIFEALDATTKIAT